MHFVLWDYQFVFQWFKIQEIIQINYILAFKFILYVFSKPNLALLQLNRIIFSNKLLKNLIGIKKRVTNHLKLLQLRFPIIIEHINIKFHQLLLILLLKPQTNPNQQLIEVSLTHLNNQVEEGIQLDEDFATVEYGLLVGLELGIL